MYCRVFSENFADNNKFQLCVAILSSWIRLWIGIPKPDRIQVANLMRCGSMRIRIWNTASYVQFFHFFHLKLLFLVIFPLFLFIIQFFPLSFYVAFLHDSNDVYRSRLPPAVFCFMDVCHLRVFIGLTPPPPDLLHIWIKNSSNPPPPPRLWPYGAMQTPSQ